jgi:mannose-1-phosphate guanylyltransferase
VKIVSGRIRSNNHAKVTHQRRSSVTVPPAIIRLPAFLWGEDIMIRDIDAVVLVGGQGSRLRPLTLSAPKPMLPTAGVPFLTHLFSRIRKVGIEHIVLGTAYQAEVFEKHFGDGSDWGLDIDYVIEDVPLGTGGAIRNVADKLRADTALIFNGDILSGVDLDALLQRHQHSAAQVTLHLTRVADPRTFGCVSTDARHRVTAFLEKDPHPVTDQINAGTYVFDRTVIDTIPTGRPVSVERETFPGLLAAGTHIGSHLDTTYWRDLGQPADFVAGSADLVLGIAPTHALPGPTGAAIVLDGATIAATAQLTGGSTIGRGSSIGHNAVIDASILFDGARIGADTIIRRSVIGAHAVIAARSTITDAVIGDRAQIGTDNELSNEIRIWPETRIPDRSLRFSSNT